MNKETMIAKEIRIPKSNFHWFLLPLIMFRAKPINSKHNSQV